MRVVFDTNIFVSAFTFPGGRADAALHRILEGADDLVLSGAILRETLEVLATKFGRDPEQLSRVAVFLGELTEFVEPEGRVSVLADEADNRILECAHEGNADAIVTGDRAMLRLGRYQEIGILSLRAYLSGPER